MRSNNEYKDSRWKPHNGQMEPSLMTCRYFTLSLLLVVFASVPDVARGAEAVYHHIHLTVPNPEEA